jgi:hypothetical protein
MVDKIIALINSKLEVEKGKRLFFYMKEELRGPFWEPR